MPVVMCEVTARVAWVQSPGERADVQINTQDMKYKFGNYGGGQM